MSNHLASLGVTVGHTFANSFSSALKSSARRGDPHLKPGQEIVQHVELHHGPGKADSMDSSEQYRMLDLQDYPLGLRNRIIKTAMDYTLAGAGLLALSPLMLLIAAAIKLDSPGPVFFVQRRGGYRNGVFSVIKFRTMNVLEDGPEIIQAERGDPRVTRVGSFLRRTSLDELPQLFNVLRGELSLIGPRPHALAHDKLYGRIVEHYASRYEIKPGITGWAQVNGYRSATRDIEQMRQRVKHDIYYINNWSLWLDIKILARTLVIFWDKQAY